jgi:P pilus assembly chaperone PapD
MAVSLLLAGGLCWAQAPEKPAPDETELPPQLSAAPTPLFLEIGARPTSASITLTNMGKKEVAVNTAVYNFELDENNEVKTIPPTPQSMDLWMVINPASFTIPPGKSQTIRISVRPPVQPDPGEHRAFVFFSQQKDDSDKTPGVKMLFRLGVGVYGRAGDIVSEGTFNDISMKHDGGVIDLSFDITSTGNAAVRLNGQYGVWPREKFNEAIADKQYTLAGSARNVPEGAMTMGGLPSLPALAGTRRVIHSRLPAPAAEGEYVFFVRGMLGSKPFKKSFLFVVPKSGKSG